jgi:hypothetical protein
MDAVTSGRHFSRSEAAPKIDQATESHRSSQKKDIRHGWGGNLLAKYGKRSYD